MDIRRAVLSAIKAEEDTVECIEDEIAKKAVEKVRKEVMEDGE